MYHYLFGISLLKSFRPFFAKHIIESLSKLEFMMLNSACIMFILFLIFAYETLVMDNHVKIIQNISDLSYYQVFCIISLAVMSVVSTFIALKTIEIVESPFVNTMMLQGISTMTFLLIATFIFKERYTWMQVLGIVFIVIGLGLINKIDLSDFKL